MPDYDDDRDDGNGRFFFHRQSRFNMNSKIMITAIISLSAVVLVVITLHIYARYILRRHARRREALRQLNLAITTTGNSGGRSSEPPAKNGLDPSVIATLPIFTFGKIKVNSDSNSGAATECAVCLSSMEKGEPARLLPNCNHAFHVDCIDTWLRTRSTCPICRAEAEPVTRLEMEQREPPARTALPPPTAPPINQGNSELRIGEATSSDGALLSSNKVGAGSSSSRLSSFRRMLSFERSRRIQPGGRGSVDRSEDLERQ